MPDPIRVGLVGANASAGSWSTVAHIPAMRAVPGVELAAVCTRREASAKAAAEAFGIERHYHDIQALVDDDVDLIAVIVKVPGHYEAVKAAIEAGKHVYCEWPLGGTLAESQAMAELCRQHGVVGAVGLQGRHDPHINHIRDLYQNGWFGELQSIEMRMTLPGAQGGEQNAPVPGASMFAVVGGHTLDQLQCMFGPLDLVAAQARGARTAGDPQVVPPGRLDESAHHISIQATLPDGTSLSADISESAQGLPGWHLSVHGTDAALEAASPMLPQITPITMQGAKTGQPTQEVLPPLDFVLPDAQGGPPRNIAIAYSRMAAAIQQNTRFQPDFDDASGVHGLLCRIQEASDRGSIS